MRMLFFAFALAALLTTPSLAAEEWVYQNGQWNKVIGGTTYFVRIDEQLGAVYGVATTCSAGSSESQEVSVVFKANVAGETKEFSRREDCSGNADKATITYDVWVSTVGELPATDLPAIVDMD